MPKVGHVSVNIADLYMYAEVSKIIWNGQSLRVKPWKGPYVCRSAWHRPAERLELCVFFFLFCLFCYVHCTLLNSAPEFQRFKIYIPSKVEYFIRQFDGLLSTFKVVVLNVWFSLKFIKYWTMKRARRKRSY